MPLQELLKAYPQEERLRQAYQEILQEIETQTSNIEGEPVNIIILKDKYKLKLTSHNKNPITINYPFNKPKSFKITGSIAYLAIKEKTKISEFRE